MPETYTATETQDGTEHTLGQVRIDSDGVLLPDPAPAAKLARLAAELNAMSVLHVDVPPEPDAPEYTLTSALIERGTPRFLPALIEHARTYYGVELRAA